MSRSAVIAATSDRPAWEIDLTALEQTLPAPVERKLYTLVDGRFCLTSKSCADPTFFGGVTEDSLKKPWIERGMKEVYDLATARGINMTDDAIERAMVLGSTELILPEDLPETVLEGESLASVPITKYYEAIHDAKKQFILKALEQTKGNYTEAAKLLGVHPNNLHRLMRQVNLKGAAKG